ncbi:MAG: AMP-binding protein [Oscillospiraceae bacterium]|nr:AMP-binding protein [Oscillospiraceae bacterium]
MNANRVKEYIEKGFWLKKTYGDLVQEWAAQYGGRLAVRDGDDTMTYRQLALYAERLAAAFLKKGIRKGDRVLLQMCNTVTIAPAYFGLFRIGAVVIPVYPALRETEVSAIAKEAEAAAYLCTEQYLDFSYRALTEAVCAAAETVRTVIYEQELKEYCQDASLVLPDGLPAPAFDDTAFLLLSGGSTGIPKLIERTHADHYYSVRKCAEICGLDKNSVYLAAMPLTHNFFICTGLFGTFCTGGTVVMSYVPSPDELLRLIDEAHVTMTSLVPAVAKMCLEMQPIFAEYGSDSLKLLQLGGAVVEPELVSACESSFQCRVMQIYGMSEGIITCTRPDDPADAVLYSQGREISEADEIRIVDENLCEVPDGTAGELIARGPYTVDHYYHNIRPEKFTPDGFYRTGDRAVRRSDGNITVLGRMDAVINRGGEKITPAEVEDALRKHPAVRDAVVLGHDDPDTGTAVCAFVLCSDPSLTEQDITAFLRGGSLAAFKQPDRILFCTEFPLTAVGKTDVKALRKMLDEVKE